VGNRGSGTDRVEQEVKSIKMQILETMNTQLVESLVQIIFSLSSDERALLEDRLFGELPYPSIGELTHLTEQGQVFEFLKDEPDLYTLNDGEPVEWH
jgi:hypothetical protein